MEPSRGGKCCGDGRSLKSLPSSVYRLLWKSFSVKSIVALANLANPFVKSERNTSNFLSFDWGCQIMAGRSQRVFSWPRRNL